MGNCDAYLDIPSSTELGLCLSGQIFLLPNGNLISKPVSAAIYTEKSWKQLGLDAL